MKKENGFIATSLLYTFFLAFIGLFIGMITIYLQNRVYLIKLEDSSKNEIYLREIKTKIDTRATFYVTINYVNGSTSSPTLTSYTDNIFKTGTTEYNLARCENIYYEAYRYYIEGCPIS